MSRTRMNVGSVFCYEKHLVEWQELDLILDKVSRSDWVQSPLSSSVIFAN